MATREALPRWVETIEYLWPFSSPVGPIPDPTPAEGPDPYGNPDPKWLRVDWREHLRTADVETPEDPYGPSVGERDPRRTTVNYVEMGEGGSGRLDLVFVHGLSGSWQNWLENLPHFARDHRVVALDMPGFGASPMPGWEITIERYGHLLRDFCHTIGIEDCALIGNSMGGFICAEAAVRDPSWFEKLALVSAAGVSHARMRAEPAEMAGRMAVAASPLVLRFQEQGLRRARIRYWAFRMLFHRPHRIRKELIWEFFANGAGKPGFLPSVGTLLGYDILDRLEEVEVPTLIVWGRNDRIVAPGDSLEYGRRLRNSRTVVFDECGHVPMAERPVRFNRILETFLAE